MSALSIREMNWTLGQRELVRDAQTRTELSLLVRLQISLDVAHSVIANGVKYENPGMVTRGKTRVEEIKQQVYELILQ